LRAGTMLKCRDVGLGFVETILRGIHLSLRGCAPFFQALKSVQGALSFILLNRGFGKVGLRSRVLDLDIAGAGFRLFDLGLGASELGSSLSIVELDEQLAFV